MHVYRRRAVTAIHANQRLVLHAKEPRIRPDPELAVPVFVDDADEAVGEPFSGSEDAEAPFPVSDKAAAFRASPQRSILRDQQRIDAVIEENGCVLAVEDHERHAVEARQTAARANPQITVLSLR